MTLLHLSTTVTPQMSERTDNLKLPFRSLLEDDSHLLQTCFPFLALPYLVPHTEEGSAHLHAVHFKLCVAEISGNVARTRKKGSTGNEYLAAADLNEYNNFLPQTHRNLIHRLLN